MKMDFFRWLMGKVGDDTPTGDFAAKIFMTIKPIEVMGDGAGTYTALRGFNQHTKTREGAWWYLRRKYPSLLKEFEAAADLYAEEIDPSWTRTRDYQIEDFLL